MNKSARLLGLTHYLGGRRPRTVSEIAYQLDVSQRTAYRYIADLESQGIPLTRDDLGYKLLDTAKLPPLNLDAEERAILTLALSNPALRAAPELARRLDELTAKLHAVLPRDTSSPEAAGRDNRTRPVLTLADTPRSGPNVRTALEPLRQAARSGHTVEILYASVSGNPKGARKARRLDPHELFQRQSAWYVAGHCHRNREVRIFRLDRITQVTPTDLRFDPPPTETASHLLAHSWNLMHQGEDHTVTLRFEPRLAPLVLNATLHPNGVAELQPDGSVRYTVKLDGLEEIARWTVGFGGGCVVEGPGGLRERVVGMAEGAMAAHELGKGRK